MGDLSEFIESIGKCPGVEYLLFVVAHCVTIPGLFLVVLIYERGVRTGHRPAVNFFPQTALRTGTGGTLSTSKIVRDLR
jgi:hypothetical protein